MSKAFTSEETEDVSIPGRAVERSAPGQERPITAQGHRALAARRDALLADRDALAETSHPDRESRLRELDHRIALIVAALESVRVVAIAPRDGTVHFASTVTLEWEDGRKQRISLVGPDEAEGNTRVSVSSPLGRALIGVRVGACVDIERPRGATSVTILDVA